MIGEARAFKSPEHAIQQIDAVIAFLGYEANQDMIRLETDVPAVQVFAWAREVGKRIERENQANKAPPR